MSTILNHETFAHAPVEEAVIEVRLDAESGYSKEQLGEIRGKIPTSYAQPEETVQKTIGLHWGGEGFQNRHTEAFVGYRAADEKRSFVAQFQCTGFLLSKLKPYVDWDDLKSEAQTLWNIYKDLGSEAKIDRISVRYLNEIRLPFVDDRLDYDEHLNYGPKNSDSFPDVVNSFLVRMEIPYKELGAISVITLKSGIPDEKSASVILDIDVLRTRNLEFTEQSMWAAFDNLRDIKNEAFFSCITEKTRQLFR